MVRCVLGLSVLLYQGANLWGINHWSQLSTGLSRVTLKEGSKRALQYHHQGFKTHISLPMSLFLRGNSKQLIFHFIIFFLISYWLRLSSKLSSMICAFLYPNLTLDPSTPLLFSPSASSASRITFSSSWRSKAIICKLFILSLLWVNVVNSI